MFAVRFGLWWTIGWRSCWRFWTLINQKPRRLSVRWRVWPSSFTWQPSAPLPPGNTKTFTHAVTLAVFIYLFFSLLLHTQKYFLNFFLSIKNDFLCWSFVTCLSLSLVVYSVTLSFSVWQSFSSSLGAHWDPGQGPEELSVGVRRRCATHLKPEPLSVCCPDNCWDPGLYPLPDK